MKPNKALATAVALALSAWSLSAQDNPQPARPPQPAAPERPPGPPRDGSQGREARRPVPGLFGLLGANRDGVIEIEKAVEALRKLDRNGDGKITPDELRAAFGRPGEGAGRFQRGREAAAGRPGQPDGAKRDGADGHHAEHADAGGNAGAWQGRHHVPPAAGAAQGNAKGRGPEQRSQQPGPQFAGHDQSHRGHHGHHGGAWADRGGSQQRGGGREGEHHHRDFAQRGEGSNAPQMHHHRGGGSPGESQSGRHFGHHHDAFASSQEHRGHDSWKHSGGPGLRFGSHRGGPPWQHGQFAQNGGRHMPPFARHGAPPPQFGNHFGHHREGLASSHDQRAGQSLHHHPLAGNQERHMPPWASHGAPWQGSGRDGAHQHPPMAQHDRGPGQTGPRAPQGGGPQSQQFNGPRSLHIAPQFGGMHRPFGMMGNPQGPGPREGFHGPQNPQPRPMGSNPPGPQNWQGGHHHHEHGPQAQSQPDGGRPPQPPQP